MLTREVETDYEIDKLQVIRQTIDHTFESPWQNLEEAIDNSIDAQANYIIITFDKYNREIIIDDNGQGITDPKDLYVFGGTKKREQKKRSPGKIHGEFGEGVKTCLSMCDELRFCSNNGNFDISAILKYPRRNLLKPVIYRVDERSSIRKEIGTTLHLMNVDIHKLQNILDHLEEISKKYSAKIALHDLKIATHIIEENQKEMKLMMKPLQSIASILEKRIEKIKLEPLIEICATASKERKLLICSDWILIKEIIPDENVFGIVNCNSLKVTRDRRSVVSNEISRLFYAELKNYTSSHYEKAIKSIKDKSEDFVKILKRLNQLADFLNLRPLPPTASSRGIANSTTDIKDKQFRKPNAKTLSDVLWIRPREESEEKPDEHDATTVQIPKNYDKPIIDLEVKRADIKDTLSMALEVNEINKNKYDERLDIQFIESEDESVIIPYYDKEEQKAIININTSSKYHNSIRDTSYYWRAMTVVIAEGFETIRMMVEEQDEISPNEFLRRVGKTVNIISEVWK